MNQAEINQNMKFYSGKLTRTLKRIFRNFSYQQSRIDAHNDRKGHKHSEYSDYFGVWLAISQHGELFDGWLVRLFENYHDCSGGWSSALLPLLHC